MTDFFLWQAISVLVANFDTGGHNYYLYSAGPAAPWRVFFYDADWGFGSKFACGRGGDGSSGSWGRHGGHPPPPPGVPSTAALDRLVPRLHGMGGGGYCDPNAVLLHSLEDNTWARARGRAEQLFGAEYEAYFKELLRQPYLQVGPWGPKGRPPQRRSPFARPLMDHA
jgi:hypothetical protein